MLSLDIFLVFVVPLIVLTDFTSAQGKPYYGARKISFNTEARIVGGASADVVDEMWNYMQALNSFVLESRRRNWEHQAKATLYDEEGNKMEYNPNNEQTPRCQNIVTRFQQSIKSVNTSNSCVRVYIQHDCRGKNFMLSPDTQYKIENLFGSQPIKSIGTCSLQSISSRSSKLPLKGRVTVDCNRGGYTDADIIYSTTP